MKVQEYLLQNPLNEQIFFSERAKFDLIVYYDQNSKRLDMAHASTLRMKKLLESHQLKRPPMMLIGGFDTWSYNVGERGVYRFPQNKENKYYSKNNTNEQKNRTLYDYVSLMHE